MLRWASTLRSLVLGNALESSERHWVMDIFFKTQLPCQFDFDNSIYFTQYSWIDQQLLKNLKNNFGLKSLAPVNNPIDMWETWSNKPEYPPQPLCPDSDKMILNFPHIIVPLICPDGDGPTMVFPSSERATSQDEACWRVYVLLTDPVLCDCAVRVCGKRGLLSGQNSYEHVLYLLPW